jgi:hypothetical protein
MRSSAQLGDVVAVRNKKYIFCTMFFKNMFGKQYVWVLQISQFSFREGLLLTLLAAQTFI